MKYKGSYFNMWDAWYLNHGETVHAFHLKFHAGDNWNVGHVYTKDLLHFHKMRDVLETLPEEQYPDDCLGKFTGCAVEKDGTYYLFSIRVLAMEGQLEVYVNDTLFLQYGIRTEAKIEAGVLAMNGQAEFRNLTVYELEK